MAVISATRIFYENMDAIKPIVVNRGGARSSKSYSVMQLLVHKFLTEKNKKFLILRKTLPALRLTTHMDYLDILSTFKARHKVLEEKQFLNYFYKDNFMAFRSLDDPEKIKSSQFNYIMLEEATEFSYNDFNQLKIRLSAPSIDNKPNQMFLCLNPIDENHWIKKKVIDGAEDFVEIVSTYKDNPFLSAEYVKKLEDLAKQDANFHRVYTLGEWGKLDNLIFSNFRLCENIPFEPEYFMFGLDFGYNAPSALIEVMADKDKKNLFLREKLYEPLLTNAQLIKKCQRIIVDKSVPIYCDTAEPDRIKEFKQAGLNAKDSRKKIHDSIDLLKTFTIHIDSNSLNLIKEFRAYSWKVDKNGTVLDEPVDFLDHGISAVRYAVYTQLGRKSSVRCRIL